ncbi:MAG TPA: hypothetical protein VG370_14370, partial [Chloroflexota bacterium]|nr:hypothetical protein [Chloroflexota bacterium]
MSAGADPSRASANPEGSCRHVLAYSGYTYERLRRLAARRPAIGAVLDEIEVLIDGPVRRGARRRRRRL